MTCLETNRSNWVPYARPKQSDRLAEIVDRVLGGMSLEQAQIQLDYALSHQTINRLKKGHLGLESTVRTFAAGFAGRICASYGDEIASRFGACDADASQEWLIEEAGFRPPRRKTSIGSTSDEPDSDGPAWDLAGATGKRMKDLSPTKQRFIVDVMESLISHARREEGLD